MKIIITENQLKTIISEGIIDENTNWVNNYIVYNNSTFINYIKEVEGVELVAYDLGDGMITIGYGHAEKKGETDMVANKTKISKEKAEELLKDDIKEKETLVNDYMLENYPNKDLTLLQKQMLTDFAFNPGLSMFPKFVKSVINKDWDTAKKEYKRYSDGVELGRNEIFYDTFLSKVGGTSSESKSTKFSVFDFTVYPNPVNVGEWITIKVLKDKLPQKRMDVKVISSVGKLVSSHFWEKVEMGILKFKAPKDSGSYGIYINDNIKIPLRVVS